MSDDPKTPGLSLSESIAEKRARVAREMSELAELEQLERLAAKFNYKLAPNEGSPSDPPATAVKASAESGTALSQPIAPSTSTPQGLTLSSLIQIYQTDPNSTFHKIGYSTRRTHEYLHKRLVREQGNERLAGITLRQIHGWHKEWTGPDGNKLAVAHAMIGQLRTLFTFGATMLEDAECTRLCALSKMRFPMSKARTERLTEDHVRAIRAKARETGQASIALAQAFQFDVELTQRDAIGEWVALKESGTSDIVNENLKWVRGLRWSDIDNNLVLRRRAIGGWQKEIEVDLRKDAPMVMEELRLLGDRPNRGAGPIIICESTGLPWSAAEFRRKWRIIADAVGVPKTVKNADTRPRAANESKSQNGNSNVTERHRK